MRLHAAGNIERVRAHHADAHQAAPRLPDARSQPEPRRSRGQVGDPLRLQHVPVGGMRGDAGGEWSASAWVIAADVARTRCPAAGACRVTQPSVGEPGVRRQQRARRSRMASLAGPGGQPGGFAEERRPATPDRVRSRSAIRHTSPLSRSRSASTSNGGRAPAGQRQHLEAQALPVVDEAVVQRLRFEPLGDGGERAVGVDQPHPGHVPVTAVRQRQHRAPAGSSAASMWCSAAR